MLTINDLRDQFDLQGEIVVNSFDENGEDEQEHYSGLAEGLSAGNPLADAEIKFMYASEISDPEPKPIMVIEIERIINE